MYKIQINFETGKQACLLRIADEAYIPFGEANTDYQAYLAWVAEGNIAEEWNPA